MVCSQTKIDCSVINPGGADYYSMMHAFKEALWLRVFLGLLRFPVSCPFPTLSDNQAACTLSNIPTISARSKHIDIRHHFIRAHVQDGSFFTTWIQTADMLAEIFYKTTSFSRFCSVLGLSVPFQWFLLLFIIYQGGCWTNIGCYFIMCLSCLYRSFLIWSSVVIHSFWRWHVFFLYLCL